MNKYEFARRWLKVFLDASEEEAHRIARQLRTYKWSDTMNLHLQTVIEAILYPERVRTILPYWIAREWIVRFYEAGGHVNIGWVGVVVRRLGMPHADVATHLDTMIKEVHAIDERVRRRRAASQ